jgi:hypothetical protein
MKGRMKQGCPTWSFLSNLTPIYALLLIFLYIYDTSIRIIIKEHNFLLSTRRFCIPIETILIREVLFN